MAYARFGQDSDVYVYPDTRGGFTCLRCPDSAGEFRCATASEMVTHLLTQHRAKGRLVPDEAIEQLRHEAAGAVVEVVFSNDRRCKAQICSRQDGLFQIWLFREVPGDSDCEPSWSPVGRDAILTDTRERAKSLAAEALRSCTGS